MSTDEVTVDRETLQLLRDFADTHGGEYGGPGVYRAILDAGRALGRDDPTPYMVWQSRWGEKP